MNFLFFSLIASVTGGGLYGQTMDHPLQIGESVKPPILVKQVDPKFSHAMRKHPGMTTALVHMVVDEKGVPQRLSMENQDDPAANESAMKAVKQWRFKPATQDDKPVAVFMNVQVNFTTK